MRVGCARLELDLIRIEGVAQKEVRVLNERELGLLLFGNKTLQGEHASDLWQLAQLLGNGQGLGETVTEHIHGVRIRFGDLHQIEHGRYRFGALAAQIERIEIEAQSGEQRQSQNGARQRGTDDPL